MPQQGRTNSFVSTLIRDQILAASQSCSQPLGTAGAETSGEWCWGEAELVTSPVSLGWTSRAGVAIQTPRAFIFYLAVVLSGCSGVVLWKKALEGMAQKL